jgi:hypothetical protein
MRGLLFAAAMLACGAAAALAAPKAALWERWTRHDAASVERIDHTAWAALLARRVQLSEAGPNLFDYAGVTSAERMDLIAYVQRLSAIRVSGLNRGEQRAFWINLYNALTVKTVLDRYPVSSIREIRSSLLSPGPWALELVEVEGQGLTLDDIEHRILRPIWRDPRLHYAVNCAAIGCPSLQPEAFTADNAEALLERGARDYVNDRRGAQVEDGRLTASSIYVWFAEDFGGDDAGAIAHLKRHARPELRDALDGVSRIDRHRYDWSLNGAR